MNSGDWQPVRLLDVAPVPRKEVEVDDPLELIGMTYPSDPEVDRLTAQCIVEEYALIGFGAPDIRALFHSPVYTALHRLFRQYGAEFVDESIAAVFDVKERC
jgi:hypothetical protein